MTVAELLFLAVGAALIYRALRPLERWLAFRLTRVARRLAPRTRGDIIDIQPFVSHPSDKEDHE